MFRIAPYTTGSSILLIAVGTATVKRVVSSSRQFLWSTLALLLFLKEKLSIPSYELAKISDHRGKKEQPTTY